MAVFPDEWELIETEPDGTARMKRGAILRVGRILFFFFGSLIAVSAIAVLARVNLEPSNMWWQWLGWLFLTPFALFALAAVREFVDAVFGQEEWRVGPDLLEISEKLFGRPKVSRYRNAVLVLDVRPGSEGTEVWWSLTLGTSAEWRRLQQIDAHEGDTDRPADLLELGTFLAEETGWPLHVPEALRQGQRISEDSA